MRTLPSLLLRGFLLQALYNFKGQQRGGFLWIVAGSKGPAGRGPFNTNPTLAGYAIGLSVSRPDEFERVRPALTAALGALGDRIQLGLLRPLSVVAGLLGAMAGPLAAAAALLLVYNPPELYLRWRSLAGGLEGEKRILADVGKGWIPRVGPPLARLLAIAIGGLAGLWLAPLLAAGRLGDALAGAVGVLLAVWLIGRGGDPTKVAPPLALAMGAAWWLLEGLMLRNRG